MKIFKINEIDDQTFYKVPKSLFSNEKYKNLSLAAKLGYAILRDRMSLSIKNGWYDENGDIYLNFKRERLADIVGCCKKTIVKVFQELTEHELIIDKHVWLNKANKIYICHVELADISAQKPENPENSRRCKKYTSGSVKATPPEMYFLHPNETNVNKTDINKTTTSVEDAVVLLEKYGLRSIAANNLISQYGLNQIQQQLVTLKAQRRKITNPAGWLVSALQKNFTSQNRPIITKKTLPVNNCKKCGGTGYYPQDDTFKLMLECSCKKGDASMAEG